MVMTALSEAGYETTIWQGKKDFDNACCLLLIGVGEWGIPEHGAKLRAAGQRGIRRIFWQLEALPRPICHVPDLSIFFSVAGRIGQSGCGAFWRKKPINT